MNKQLILEQQFKKSVAPQQSFNHNKKQETQVLQMWETLSSSSELLGD